MQPHHISVCICTFKRPVLLQKLLDALARQYTGDRFTFSIVVADNDSAKSAEPVAAKFRLASRLPVTYCVEPQQNIALVRNQAVSNAGGDLIAFIDDDEVPEERWLWHLLHTLEAHDADGVLGPVKPYFEAEPPRWVKKGRFFDRPDYATGYQVSWPEARSGNVLFRTKMLEGVAAPFREQFAAAGEDVDFFRRMTEKGCRFVWCSEAVAHELVPASRCRRSYLLRRALLRGSNFPKHPAHRVRNIVRSLIAVPCYTLALPVLAVLGQHLFVRYLIKLLDHTSRLLAFLGLNLASERQT